MPGALARKCPWVGARPSCSAAGWPLGRWLAGAERGPGRAAPAPSADRPWAVVTGVARISFRRGVGITVRAVKGQNATQAFASRNPLPSSTEFEMQASPRGGSRLATSPAPAWRGAWLHPAECCRLRLRACDAPSGPPGKRAGRRHAGSGKLVIEGLGPCSWRAGGHPPAGAIRP